MPRYPMLLSGILRYTDTAENQENEEMMREKELLERAKDSVQVTVSEINKRVREEDLNGLLNDIKTHLSIHDFLKGLFSIVPFFSITSLKWPPQTHYWDVSKMYRVALKWTKSFTMVREKSTK